MFPTELILALVLLPPMLVLSGLVSGSETALFGIDHPGRARLANASPAAAEAVTALLRYPRHLLTTLLALNNLINVTYFTVSAVLVAGLNDAGHPALAAILFVSSLSAIILVGEIAAKLLANARTVAFCRAVAGPWILVIRTGWPVWNALDRYVLRPLVRLASTAPSPAERPNTSDLAAVLSAHASDAAEAPADQKLLAQIIKLREHHARHAMQPRVEVPILPIDAPAQRLDETIKSRRTVLLTDTEGQPLGWLDAVAHFHNQAPSEPAPRRALLVEPHFVPELATLDAVLRQLRDNAQDRAVVVDELGEVAGVIRIEDIVATLLEHAADQNADTESQPRLVALGVFDIPGRWPARALLDDLDLAHAEADQILSRVSTVGGLALALLGRVPEPGDRLELPGATLTVTETTGRVVDRVEVAFHDLREMGGEP